ncbi:MAG: S1 RNA-binding domain-containing protein [Thermotogaceae bacterium]|nr:S1 RNA-binding domain-containing protein [Thermotogaceae bacterium]
MKVGDTIKGRVVKTMKYGAIVEIEGGEKGFVHISKISKDYVKSVEEYLREGQQIEGKIIGKTKDGKWEITLKDSNLEKLSEQQPAQTEEDKKKADFEKKLKRFLRDSEAKFAEYRKRVEKKGGRW